MTLLQLSALSGVSVSHLARIESGSRFPSPVILRKIAKPLGFAEQELFILAGYMSPKPSMVKEEPEQYVVGRLDIHVAKALAQEPVEVQRCLIKLLPVLKSIANDIAQIDAAKKQFSADELKQFIGKDDPHCYVVCCSKVYDVSKNPVWETGVHADSLEAGGDLTLHMKDAPHGCEVLNNYPIVGELRQSR